MNTRKQCKKEMIKIFIPVKTPMLNLSTNVPITAHRLKKFHDGQRRLALLKSKKVPEKI